MRKNFILLNILFSVLTLLPSCIESPISTNKAVHEVSRDYKASSINHLGVTGYGKISKITGRRRTKIVSGHWRRTSRGYTYVNPYARS